MADTRKIIVVENPMRKGTTSSLRQPPMDVAELSPEGFVTKWAVRELDAYFQDRDGSKFNAYLLSETVNIAQVRNIGDDGFHYEFRFDANLLVEFTREYGFIERFECNAVPAASPLAIGAAKPKRTYSRMDGKDFVTWVWGCEEGLPVFGGPSKPITFLREKTAKELAVPNFELFALPKPPKPAKPPLTWVGAIPENTPAPNPNQIGAFIR